VYPERLTSTDDQKSSHSCMILYWGAKNCPSIHLASLHNQRLYQVYRLPDSCIQLSQLPGSRPMAQEPGPAQCVARDWPRPGATLARLRSDPASYTTESSGTHTTGTPFNKKYANEPSLISGLRWRFHFTKKRSIPKIILTSQVRRVFVAGGSCHV